MIRVAIVGTAGRDPETMAKATEARFNKMIELALKTLFDEYQLKPGQITLVSGGAAVSDHVAVAMFLDKYVKHIELHLPYLWNAKKMEFFEDEGLADYKTHPGRRSNELHRQFQAVSNIPSLEQLNYLYCKAAERAYTGVTMIVHGSFSQRNAAIAASADYLIAFGFDENITEGTAQTYNLFTKSKKFIVVQ